jgi:hypothetical protein
VEGNKGVIRISPPVKGGNNFANSLFQSTIHFFRKNKEQKVVGKKGNHKDIDKNNTRRDGEQENGGTREREESKSFFVRRVKNVPQGDAPPDRNTKVGGRLT